MPEKDLFNLERFVTAQSPIFETVLEELKAGRKRSHWMWFVFPQLRGLGYSTTAQFYGIASLAEAQAYLNHPVLGARLVLCTQTIPIAKGRTLGEIFGSPDDLKFQSCMTLFAHISPGINPFQTALDTWCNGEKDSRTLSLLCSG